MEVLKDKRILIVEDDVINISVYAAILKRTGAIVIQDMRNHNTVKFVLQNLPVDVILLDLMLRYEISGYDTFEELKRIPELADIPIIAVSAADPETEIPRARSMGFAGFIGKPINAFKFPEQIKSCIEGNRLFYSHQGDMETQL